MKESHRLLKKYLKNEEDDIETLTCLLFAAIKEYIEIKTGKHLHLKDVGLRTLKQIDKWIYNDWKFKEWFKNEYGFWLEYENAELVFVDLRLIGLKKSYKPLGFDLPPEAKPRDVDELIPEV